MIFRVGQKVSPFKVNGEAPGGITLPKLDPSAVYVVREYDTRGLDAGCHKQAALRLVGIYGPVQDTTVGRWEVAYRADRFRPIVGREYDISIFTKMLNPSLEDMRALIRENAQ